MDGMANDVKQYLAIRYSIPKSEIVLDEQIIALCAVLEGKICKIRRELYLVAPEQTQELALRQTQMAKREIAFIGRAGK